MDQKAEQSQLPPTPAIDTENQIFKKNNTAKIIASITSVMAVVGIFLVFMV